LIKPQNNALFIEKFKGAIGLPPEKPLFSSSPGVLHGYLGFIQKHDLHPADTVRFQAGLATP